MDDRKLSMNCIPSSDTALCATRFGDVLTSRPSGVYSNRVDNIGGSSSSDELSALALASIQCIIVRAATQSEEANIGLQTLYETPLCRREYSCE